MEQKPSLKELLEKFKHSKPVTQNNEANNEAVKRFLERVRARIEELKKQAEENKEE